MPGRQVEDDVDVGRADPLDDLAVESRVATALAGLRVADVDVDDRRAGARGLDRRVGDLLGGDRHVLAAAGGVAGARDRAGDEDLPVHGTTSGARCEHAVHMARRTSLGGLRGGRQGGLTLAPGPI